jgi:hypothetical protein
MVVGHRRVWNTKQTPQAVQEVTGASPPWKLPRWKVQQQLLLWGLPHFPWNASQVVSAGIMVIREGACSLQKRNKGGSCSSQGAGPKGLGPGVPPLMAWVRVFKKPQELRWDV